MWPYLAPTLLACLLQLLAASANAAQQTHETLTIMVEDAAAPWSNRDGTGYANDVVLAAFKEMAVEARLKVVPYSRCKYMVLNGQVAACFNMSWQPEFQGRIKLAARPIFKVSNDVFESIKTPLPKPPDGQCILPPGTVVGITRDYEYSTQVMALQTSGVVFENSLSDLTSLQKLAARRFQAAVIMSNDLEVRNRKAQQSGTEDTVRFAFNCGLVNSTIGFSLSHPDGLRALEVYDEGYRRIEANGVLKKLHQRWFPEQ
ncbi:periplasmic component of amino acid ABC-type transporter/signal transduction system [Pseudomonas sp. GM33]|uniref:substrate-binding periplasmic protein n=1 Tax=Pseudomonas TaxID=286 RepID=UPI0002702B88|nr:MULTISPECIES: transporter substrate-binding domain-containing protein [Pseudomonas]EJM42614.1 periplasmic component of amino acid ABC-type transporter/signal transduction system [Pseudomonas sp. GM33]UVM02482.1 transporter substrate-binding domain-containing protein [Pseudomonas laurylsulfatiphila]